MLRQLVEHWPHYQVVMQPRSRELPVGRSLFHALLAFAERSKRLLIIHLPCATLIATLLCSFPMSPSKFWRPFLWDLVHDRKVHSEGIPWHPFLERLDLEGFLVWLSSEVSRIELSGCSSYTLPFTGPLALLCFACGGNALAQLCY